MKFCGDLDGNNYLYICYRARAMDDLNTFPQELAENLKILFNFLLRLTLILRQAKR